MWRVRALATLAAPRIRPRTTPIDDDEPPTSEAPSSAAADATPRRFGKYRILAKVGEGATGVVYKAQDAETGRTVALKILRESLTAEKAMTERFALEAEAAGALKHPNVVTIYESGEFAGRLFIAMAYLQGPSLARIVEKIRSTCGPQPELAWLHVLDEEGVPAVKDVGNDAARTYAARIGALLAPVADALGALWDARCVHRDVKPQNLVMDGHGRLVLTDFGLAKALGNQLTSTLATLGTPAYMSPEQARGESRNADGRTDIHGLGATLFEALTLCLPIAADTYAEAVAAVLTAQPPLIASICPDYPMQLSVVVRRCLEKEPDDRYQSASRLADDLRRIAAGAPPRIRQVSVGRRVRRFVGRHPRAAVYTGVVGVLVSALVAYVFTRSATIRVTSHPRAALHVDGENLGNVPWEGSVSRGEHVLRLTHERFLAYEEHVDLEPGQLWSGEPILTPREPDDQVAIQLLSDSLGLTVKLPATRPPKGPETAGGLDVTNPALLLRRVVLLLAPRGDVSREWSGARVYKAVALDGLKVILVEMRDEPHVLYTASVPAAVGESVIGFPPEAIAAARAAGGSLEVVVGRSTHTGSGIAAEVRPTDRQGPRGRLARFGPEDRETLHVRLVVAAELLTAGLLSEAFEMSTDLLAEEGDNLVALRIALDAMWRLGQATSPLYKDLRTRYLVRAR